MLSRGFRLNSMFRKPHGLGRAAIQKRRRDDLAAQVAGKLLEELDLDYVEQTGSLFPRRCNLRKKVAWKFLFLKSIPGRAFTKRLCLGVTRRVACALPFQLPVDPKEGMEGHLKAQAGLLQKLAKRCKRATRSAMELETQPWA